MSLDVKTKVIKRNGEEVHFDLQKIENAINAANAEVDNIYKMNEYQIRAIADDIALQVSQMPHASVSCSFPSVSLSVIKSFVQFSKGT